jgi:rhodanese-related sulfurtransferase
MKMMDCSTLGTLVVNHEPIELIDVRSKNEFAAMHIPGARSIPFGELEEPGLFRKRRLTTGRVYVIAANGYARASLAAELLRAAGCVNAVPVDGGMKDWLARGFPVRARRFSLRVPDALTRGALLPVMAAGGALLLDQTVIAALLSGIAALLLLKANLLSRTRGQESTGRDLNHVIKRAQRRNDPGLLERSAREHQDTCAA